MEEIFMCRIKDTNGGDMRFIGEKKVEVGDIIQVSLSSTYPISDHGGLATGNYLVKKFIKSIPTKLNGRKIKLHYFEVTKS